MHAFLQFQCQGSSVPACQDKARRTCQRWGDKGQTGIKEYPLQTVVRLDQIYIQRMKAAKRWRSCYRVSVTYIPVFSCLFVISYFAVGFLQIHLFYWFRLF